MKTSLTVVLPVHNGEHRLRQNVREMLEIASDLTKRFSILIVDDGSTDDTYELACELAAEFPQVSVLRQAVQSGLGAALSAARKHIDADVVVVHDGTNDLSPEQIYKLWHQYHDRSFGERETAHRLDSSELAATHRALERAHRNLLGFSLMPSLGQTLDESTTDGNVHGEIWRQDAGAGRRAKNVGSIPKLPRPNFLQSISNFAWGE